MGNHHDQGDAADFQEAGQATSKPTDHARDDQAAGQPRGGDEYAREHNAGDGDDPPPVTGDEPSPR